MDYEHWFFSLKNDYATKPDVQAWAKEVREQYKVERLFFFANFTQAILQNEITRIRVVTNDIIETQFGLPGSHMKDMSDFVMLDHIYRAAADRRPPGHLSFSQGTDTSRLWCDIWCRICGKMLWCTGYVARSAIS